MNVRSEVFGRLAAADRAGELPDYVRQFLGAELLPIKEVLSSVSSGNRKAAICSDCVLLKEPSDGLEPLTPSLPWRCSTN